MLANATNSPNRTPGWWWTLGLLGLGCWLMAVCWHEWLCDGLVAASFDCEGGRRWLIRRLGGKLTGNPLGSLARVPFQNVLIANIVFTLLWWLGGAAVLARRRRVPFSRSLLDWGFISSLWWLLAASWTVCRFLTLAMGWSSGFVVISHLPEMWLSFASAGWMTAFVCQFIRWREPAATSAIDSSLRVTPAVWLSIAIYTLVFGVMNTLLYNNLLIPHGDSAMYEEHLWNLLHGKGFRSFIDKGLFLGEHIQVLHLGLIPIYIVWPSHVLLEWCESLGLALGAIPVYRMALRHSHSRWQATCLACAYLLYVPMQRLDISIDFKTFRPEAFGIPLLLASFDALDARRWKSFAAWLFAALMVKEDYALIIGPLGLWLAIHEYRVAVPGPSRWTRCLPGLTLSVAAVAYLWWAVKIVIPHFKGGQEVHFAKYYDRYGQTTNEIVVNMLSHPHWLLGDLLTPENCLFGAALCLSLALLPLWSPARLAVGAPLFAALCLNQIARNTQHHFHAPLVAVVFWAAAHGLSNVQRVAAWWEKRPNNGQPTSHPQQPSVAGFAVIMTLFASSGFHFWHSLSPGGLPFWDTHSGARWSQKYAPTERAAQFIHVWQQIPPTAHVASTDFIHPRFNHHARSYDYSSYRPDVPADVEYLIIDARGPYMPPGYSPQDVPEYQKHPERWELQPDETHGYFYIFRRRG